MKLAKSKTRSDVVHPYQNTRIAEYLRTQINALSARKSQQDIARQAGFTSPNIITMMKQGQTRVPLDRVPGLATALFVDPTFLFRLALEQFWPEDSEIVDTIFKNIVTANEMKWVRALRKAAEEAGEYDPGPDEKQLEIIAAIFEKPEVEEGDLEEENNEIGEAENNP